MLTNSEKSQIRLILSSPQWQTVERFAEMYRVKIRNESVLQDTEWDTIKIAVFNEGQIQGITRFFQELLNQSQ